MSDDTNTGGEDVTARLLDEALHGPGANCARVAKAKPAKTLTPTLADALMRLARTDCTMGRVSKALAYGSVARYTKPSEHSNLIRLIKGGFVRVFLIRGAPPHGSRALVDSPYGKDSYYVLRIV